jgi:Ankyrin repeats (3 copies)
VQFLVGETRIWVDSGHGREGGSALMEATRAGHNDVVQFLVAEWVSLKVRDNEGRNCIYCAAENGHIDVLRSLGDPDVGVMDAREKSDLFSGVLAGIDATPAVRDCIEEIIERLREPPSAATKSAHKR